jgi:DNA-binding response OmpR family regulator
MSTKDCSTSGAECVQKNSHFRHANIPEYQLTFRDLRVDLITDEITYADRPVRCGQIVSRMLKILMLNAETWLTRGQIEMALYGFNRNTNAVDANVSRLRKDMREAGITQLIVESGYGQGYRLMEVRS